MHKLDFWCISTMFHLLPHQISDQSHRPQSPLPIASDSSAALSTQFMRAQISFWTGRKKPKKIIRIIEKKSNMFCRISGRLSKPCSIWECGAHFSTQHTLLFFQWYFPLQTRINKFNNLWAWICFSWCDNICWQIFKWNASLWGTPKKTETI